jgi:hypothetical protein
MAYLKWVAPIWNTRPSEIDRYQIVNAAWLVPSFSLLSRCLSCNPSYRRLYGKRGTTDLIDSLVGDLSSIKWVRESHGNREKNKRGNIMCWLLKVRPRIWFAMGETSDTRPSRPRRSFSLGQTASCEISESQYYLCGLNKTKEGKKIGGR